MQSLKIVSINGVVVGRGVLHPVLNAEWSTLSGRDCRDLVVSLIELKYFHDVATPALLCHKEPARRIQRPLLGALEPD